MDNPDKKPKQAEDEQSEPVHMPSDPVGPPPDPRGESGSSGSIDSGFDPNQVNIEDHEDAFNEGEVKSDVPIAEPGPSKKPEKPEKPEEMKINKPPKSRLGRLIRSKKFWLVFVLVLLALAAALWFIQETRVWIVNTAGLRVPVTVNTRTAAEPGQPSAVLQKTMVNLNSDQAESDDKGQARFNSKYGEVNVTAQKNGYETAQKSDFYDFDPFFGLLGARTDGREQQLDLQLKSVGIPLKFKVIDWVSGQPITSGEFKIGDVVATPDENGVVGIKIPPTDETKVSVSVKVNGYNDKQTDLIVQTDPVQQLALVPVGRDYFISKSSGQFGVYSSNLDGSDVEQVIAPTANETSAVNFSISPDGKYGVLASTRDGKHDAGGNLVQKLYTVKMADGTLSAQDEGLWFNFADWANNTLVYTTSSKAGEQRLASLDASGNKKTDLGTAADYSHVRVSLNSAVYILNNPAGSENAANNPELRVVPVAGGVEKNIGNKVADVTQTTYDRVAYRTPDNAWHQYDLNAATLSGSITPTSTGRIFLSSTSADGQTRLFIDKVNGVSTVFTQSVATSKETKLYGTAGLAGPLRWAGNLAVFRADSAQTADYVQQISSTEPKKIGDITASTSPSSAIGFDLN